MTQPKTRAQVLLGFLIAGVIIGYVLHRVSAPRTPPLVAVPPTAAAPLPSPPTCPQTFEAAYLDCRAALTAAKSDAARVAEAPVPVAAPKVRKFERAVVNGREMTVAVDEDGKPAVDAKQGKRYVPYQPYREYRQYRNYKPYKSATEARLGTAEDCAANANARECFATEAYCQRMLQDEACVGTEIYCAKYPDEEVCHGTKFSCGKNPRQSSCEGTQAFCQDGSRRNQAICRGTESYCDGRQQSDPYCFGTQHFCNIYGDTAICDSDDA